MHVALAHRRSARCAVVGLSCLLGSAAAEAQVEWFLPGSDGYLVVYASALVDNVGPVECTVATVGPPSASVTLQHQGCKTNVLAGSGVRVWQPPPAQASATQRTPQMTATLDSSAELDAIFSDYSAKITGLAKTVLTKQGDWPATNSGFTRMKGDVQFRVRAGRSLDLVLTTNLQWTPGAISNRGAFQLRGISNDASSVNYVPRYSSLSTDGNSREEYRATLRPGVYQLTWHAENSEFPVASRRVDIDLELKFTPWTCKQGTDDRDGDALPDVWEEVGVLLPSGVCVSREYVFDANGDARLDAGELPDPHRKDLYVEVDWMPGQEVGISAFRPVIDAFNNAPVANPDSPLRPGSQAPGIALHVQLDEEASRFVGEGASDVCFGTEGATKQPIPGITLAECSDTPFTAVRQQYFMPKIYRDETQPFPATPTHYRASRDEIRQARQLVFRYALLAARIDNLHSRMGYGMNQLGRGGNDFVVVPQAFYDWDYNVSKWSEHKEQFANRYPCTVYALLAFNFMHELGHTLGLEHGGFDFINSKPNYLSAMSYSYMLTFCAPGAGGRLDYSRAILPHLDERAISEPAGVGFLSDDMRVKAELKGRRIVFGEELTYAEFERRTKAAGVTLTSVAPSFNSNCINHDPKTIYLRLPMSTAAADGEIDWDQDCRIDPGMVQADVNNSDLRGSSPVEAGPVLAGWDDWSNLRFNFRVSPYYRTTYGQ